MDRKMLDRLVPLLYAALMLATVLFFRKGVAPVAIFGALVIAAYFSAVRPRFVAAERAARDGESGAPEDTSG
jgi:uncharacterized membrane protein